MNDNMKDVVIIAALAVYKVQGAVAALAYLSRNGGFTVNEGINILALYDRFEDAAKLGILH